MRRMFSGSNCRVGVMNEITPTPPGPDESAARVSRLSRTETDRPNSHPVLPAKAGMPRAGAEPGYYLERSLEGETTRGEGEPVSTYVVVGRFSTGP